MQAREVGAPHFHIEVLGREAHEPVPHAAPDEARAADGPDGEEGFAERLGQRQRRNHGLRLANGGRRMRRESTRSAAAPRPGG